MTWAVTEKGIVVDDGPDRIVDVLLGDQRIWSVHSQVRARNVDGVRLVRWPPALAPRVTGSARWRLIDHGDDEVLLDEQVTLGGVDSPASLVDEHDQPLTLDKFGRLQVAFAAAAEGTVEGLVDGVELVLGVLAQTGLPAFPAYGTLLGAVREGRVLAHDSDADVAYFSEHSAPVDLIRESYRIERALVAAGLKVRRGSGLMMKVRIPGPGPGRRGIDVFCAFFVGDTLYVIHQVATRMRRDQVLPLGTVTLQGRELPAPADPDAFLTGMYGPTWRVPDPAFRFSTPREVHDRLDAWIGGLRGQRNHWMTRYGPLSDQPVRPHREGWSAWVLDRMAPEVAVLDIGCGRGGDALAYAVAGHRVSGVDLVPAALPPARRRARVRGLTADFSVLNLADLRHVLATTAWWSRRPTPAGRAVTARLLLDAVPAQARENVWRMCRTLLRPGPSSPGGGRAYVEVADAAVSGRQQDRFVEEERLEPVPLDQLQAEAASWGGTCTEIAHVRDGGDAPATTRMVVTWQ